MDTNPRCETCRWWVFTYQDGTGVCRRHPPTAIEDHQLPHSAWPVTGDSDFCGEHAPKEGDPPVTRSMAENICERRAAGEGIVSLANDYGLSLGAIAGILDADHASKEAPRA